MENSRSRPLFGVTNQGGTEGILGWALPFRFSSSDEATGRILIATHNWPFRTCALQQDQARRQRHEPIQKERESRPGEPGCARGLERDSVLFRVQRAHR